MRTGLVYLGDVADRNAILTATGCITYATVNSAFGSGDCLINISFNDNGYVPVIMITM